MKVLLVDDDAIARLLVSRVLRSLGSEVITAVDGDTAWKLASDTDAPFVVLIDWHIPGLSAESVCQRIKAFKSTPPVHVIALVSRKEDRDLAVESGCDDYLMKPADVTELCTRTRLGWRLTDMASRLPTPASGEETEASHDVLTGLWNRAAILQFLGGQFARSSRDGVSVAVAVADLDRFSQYNERNGRAAGDALLRQVAIRMRNAVRPYDWLGRLDGDSFLIIAPDCTLSNGFAMCERLRSLVVDVSSQNSGPGCAVTMSFGLATTAESGVTNEHGLLRAAETALYQAKQNGRNRVEMAKRAARVRSAQNKVPQAQGRELVQ